MSEANKAVARRFYESINAGRLEIVDEVVAENFVDHEGFPGVEPNRAGVRQLFGMMRKAFPDFQMTIEDMIAEGDRVFIRAIMIGTHKGEFLGVAPTGKRIAVPFGDFVRLEAGRIVEHWGVTDSGVMMQQLGQGGGPGA